MSITCIYLALKHDDIKCSFPLPPLRKSQLSLWTLSTQTYASLIVLEQALPTYSLLTCSNRGTLEPHRPTSSITRATHPIPRTPTPSRRAAVAECHSISGLA